MKRTLLALVLGCILVANSGCCMLCGRGCCSCGNLGCGERYWGEWCDCGEPCDECGQWAGHGGGCGCGGGYADGGYVDDGYADDGGGDDYYVDEGSSTRGYSRGPMQHSRSHRSVAHRHGVPRGMRVVSDRVVSHGEPTPAEGPEPRELSRKD